MKIDNTPINPRITLDTVMDACQRRASSLDNPGFCLTCAAEADGCEPDARKLECEACGANAVYGADEILLAMVVS